MFYKSNRIHKISIILLLILLIPICSWSATYYVSKSGNDENPGTFSQPWETINKANTTLKPGDTVLIREGVYVGEQIRPDRSGTAGSRITYKNYGNESVKITDTDTPLLLSNRSHITIHGIKIINCDKYLVMDNGNYNHFEYLTISDMRNYDSWTGFTIRNSSYNWVHHCSISEYGVYENGKDKGEMFWIGGNSPTDSTHNLIEDNHIFYGGHTAFKTNAAKYTVIRNNYFHNEEWHDNDTYGNRIAAIKDVSNGKGGWALIEGNRFAFTGIPNDTNYSSGIQAASGDTIYRKNMFYSAKGAGLKITTLDGEAEYADNNYVYNNVFFNNGIGRIPDDRKRILWIRSGGSPSVYNTIIKNNIFYENKQDVDGQNIYEGSWGGGGVYGTVTANNWESGDPLFVDAVASRTTDPFNQNYPDFTLQSSSPCIDAGDFLTTTTSTGSGTAIPVTDAHYFMDGWGIIEGDRIQLENQNETAQIISVDYENNILTLNKSLSWSTNQGVSLKYDGVAPDIGAFESIDETSNYNLLPPTNLTISKK